MINMLGTSVICLISIGIRAEFILLMTSMECNVLIDLLITDIQSSDGVISLTK